MHTRVAPRRATGPDLSRALCGSEGTIGFITSAVLRIHKKPEARLVAAYLLPSIDSAVIVRSTSRCARKPRRRGCASTTPRRPRATSAGSGSPPGQALLCAGTAGPTDLAACDRDLITSAVVAEGGEMTDSALAELWWRRLHAGEPTPAPTPTLQMMATPTKLRAVYHAVIAEAERLGVAARAHISRFDPDGGLMFFTISAGDGPDEPGELDAARLHAIEQVAEAAGGWPLGARATKLDSYLRTLREVLDPRGIMNPGTLA